MSEDAPLCEMCGQNPVRRADYEYRQSNPEDPWMMICEDCDKQSGGSRPARSQGKTEGTYANGRKCAKKRLEYYIQELNLDRAMVALEFGQKKMKMPKDFSWLYDLNEKQVKELKAELLAVKMVSAQFIFSPFEYETLDVNMQKIKTICGTFQLMSSLKKVSPPGIASLPKPEVKDGE